MLKVFASFRVRFTTLTLPPEGEFGVSDAKPPATKLFGTDVIEAVYPQATTEAG